LRAGLTVTEEGSFWEPAARRGGLGCVLGVSVRTLRVELTTLVANFCRSWGESAWAASVKTGTGAGGALLLFGAVAAVFDVCFVGFAGARLAAVDERAGLPALGCFWLPSFSVWGGLRRRCRVATVADVHSEGDDTAVFTASTSLLQT
jgi:hypothetical protein